MITDEKRREVAMFLRRCDCTGRYCVECMRISEDLFGNKNVLCNMNAPLEKLADLIYPPTTPYVCEKCGGEWPSDIMFERCPYCGTVIDDG